MKKPELMKMPEKFLPSMEELVVRYKKARSLKISKGNYELYHGMNCLLCNPLGTEVSRDSVKEDMDIQFRGYKYYTFESACAELGCPWIVITGLTCCGYSNRYIKNGDIQHVYASSDNRIMTNRIKQLQRWIAIYKKYIDENKN